MVAGGSRSNAQKLNGHYPAFGKTRSEVGNDNALLPSYQPQRCNERYEVSAEPETAGFA